MTLKQILIKNSFSLKAIVKTKSFICFSTIVFTLNAFSKSNVVFEENSFDSVEINHSSGRLNISNSESISSLEFLNNISKKDCDSGYEIIDRKLIINTEKKVFTLKTDCTLDIDLKLPKAIALKINQGIGYIDVFGIFNKLDLSLGSGDVSIQGKIQNLDLDVAAGRVTVSGLEGYGKITLLSGDLDVKYQDPGQKQNQLFVSKSVGDTKIQIPKGHKVTSKLKTLLGNITNKIKSGQSGQFYFSVKTNVGDISMETYDIK